MKILDHAILNRILIILTFWKALNIKYVWALVSIVIFYFFLFESRHFYIHTNWRVLCRNQNKNCNFNVNINKENNSVLIYSQDSLLIADPYSHLDVKSDVLTEPLYHAKVNIENSIHMSSYIDNKTNDVHLYSISVDNNLNYYINWQLRKSVKLAEILAIKSSGYFNAHEVKVIPKDRLLVVVGNFSNNNVDYHGFMSVFNSSTLNVVWNFKYDPENSGTMKSTDKPVLNINYKHWKLRLMEQHRSNEHVKQKRSIIDMMQFLPVIYPGYETFRLVKARKFQNYMKHITTETDHNYNAFLLIHKQGIVLLELTNGLVLGRIDMRLDEHSTYTWYNKLEDNSVNHIVQVKFISKLDKVADDHIDIAHDTNDINDRHMYNHKIHCNLVFSKVPLTDQDPTVSLPQSFSWSVGHLCDPVSFWDYPRFNEKSWLEDADKAIPPLITKEYARTSIGFWGKLYHITGRKLFERDMTRQIVCMSSDGLLTSYSTHGHLNWRVSAQVGWFHITRMSRSSFDDSYSVKAYRSQFKPSLSMITLKVFNEEINAILSVGFDSFSLVDSKDGHLVASHTLPCTPVSTPSVISVPYSNIWSIYGDKILVFTCDNMAIGFSVSYEIPWVQFVVICLIIFCSVVFISWILNPHNEYIHKIF